MLIWPGVIDPPRDLEHARTVVRSLLAGVSVLALIGIRYPLQLLPLLLFELVWKSTWVLAFGLPRWLGGRMDAAAQQTWFDCLVTLPLFLIAIPWRYVWRHYVKQPGDRWTTARRPGTAAEGA